MFQGVCLDKLGISVTHSDRFHQSIPEDYIPKLLEQNNPISFHHFTKTNPKKNYEKWFRAADEVLIKHRKQDREL